MTCPGSQNQKITDLENSTRTFWLSSTYSQQSSCRSTRQSTNQMTLAVTGSTISHVPLGKSSNL